MNKKKIYIYILLISLCAAIFVNTTHAQQDIIDYQDTTNYDNEEIKPLTEEERWQAFVNNTSSGDFSIAAGPTSITATELNTVWYGDLGINPDIACSRVRAKTNEGDIVDMVCVETNVDGMYTTHLYTYNTIRPTTNDLLRKSLYYGVAVGSQGNKQRIYGIAGSGNGVAYEGGGLNGNYPVNEVNGVRNVALEVQGIGWKDPRTARQDLKAYLITHHAASKIFLDAGLGKESAIWTFNMNSELREATLKYIDIIKKLPSPPEQFKVYLAYPPSGVWSQAYMFPVMEEMSGKLKIIKQATM